MYYVVTESDIRNDRGNFDSIRCACASFFGEQGEKTVTMENCVYRWHRDDFYAVLLSGMTADSSFVINIATSNKPILTGEKSGHWKVIQ